MKRALLVTTGTAVGLVSVLSYSSQAAPALAGAPAGADGLGAPAPASSLEATEAPATSAAPGNAKGTRHASKGKGVRRPKPSPSGTPSGKPTTKSPSARPTPTTSPKPSKSTAKPSPTKATSKAPAASAAPSSKAATAKPTTAKPKPKPTPKPAGGPIDYLGPVSTSQYGPTQVSIRVSNGTLVDVWATIYPTGTSEPYSQMAIPILKAQTLAAKSASIAGATGASFTSAAWKTSLAGALARAKL